MSLLRIYGFLDDSEKHCRWALLDVGREAVTGECALADLSHRAERVQLVIPAAQVFLTRARLPAAARRRAGSLLSFAVEEETLGEPDSKEVIWLGSSGGGDDSDVLAVMDKQGLQAWLAALDAQGIHDYELHCETLLLPRRDGEWSLAWDGREGFLRTAELEGAATDCGDKASPPLSLRLLLEDAAGRGASPQGIALYVPLPAAAPDIGAWQQVLGVPLRLAGNWDWRSAAIDAGIALEQKRRPWRIPAAVLTRLRPAAWIVAAALTMHALALVADWTLLSGEQRSLRAKMETRFRAAFPDAVAVVDPALQMRRKLAEARHAAGLADSADFLPMIEKVAVAMKELPQGVLHIVSYESGRMTLELSAPEDAASSSILRRMTARLEAAGLAVETAKHAGSGSGTLVLTVRSS